MRVQEIITRVRAVIDELSENDSNFIDEDTDQKVLNRIIVDKISSAQMYILRHAPLDLIDDSLTMKLDDDYKKNNFEIKEGVGIIKLPSSILRIISARLSSWKISPIPVSENSTEYMMQSDEYAKGTPERPVSAIVRTDGALYMEFYTSKTSTDTLVMSVIEKPTITHEELDDPDSEITVPEQLENAFIYQIAALTCVALREDISSSLFGISKQYLGINEESND